MAYYLCKDTTYFRFTHKTFCSNPTLCLKSQIGQNPASDKQDICNFAPNSKNQPHNNERTLSGFSRRRRRQCMPLSRLAVNWPQHRVGFSLAHPLRQPVWLPAHWTALHAERALQPRPRISPIAHRWALRWLHHVLHFFQRSATSSPLWHALAVCLLRLRKCCTRARRSVCRTMGWRKNPPGIIHHYLTPHGKFRHRRRQRNAYKKSRLHEASGPTLKVFQQIMKSLCSFSCIFGFRCVLFRFNESGVSVVDEDVIPLDEFFDISVVNTVTVVVWQNGSHKVSQFSC